MNLPNKLTVLRVLMIPFFVVFMLTDLGGASGKWIALAIFIITQFDRSFGWKNRKKIQSCNKFRKIYDLLAG